MNEKRNIPLSQYLAELLSDYRTGRLSNPPYDVEAEWEQQDLELVAAVKLLEDSLKFYADKGNWKVIVERETDASFQAVEEDQGEVARRALRTPQQEHEDFQACMKAVNEQYSNLFRKLAAEGR